MSSAGKPPVNQLTEGHMNLLEAIYRVLQEHDKWPTFGYLETLLVPPPIDQELTGPGY